MTRTVQIQPRFTVISTGEFEPGLHYVKIVQSPEPERQILDIMFKAGLRLTVDLRVGDPVNNIKPTLISELMICRPGQSEEIEPVIEVIGSCISRAIADPYGLIQSYNFDDETNSIQRSWEQQMFLLFLKNRTAWFEIPYEVAETALYEYYKLFNDNPPIS